MTEEELQAEHAEQHDPRLAPVAGCQFCQDWRAQHRCHGLGSSNVVIPTRQSEET